MSNRVAAVPLSLARWFVSELGAVRLLTMAEELAQWPICIAYRRSRGLTPAASLFARCVKSAVEQQLGIS